MRVVIIDDNRMDYDFARVYVQKAFPAATFVPSDRDLFTSWNDVYEHVRANVVDGPDVVILVDLLLTKARDMHPVNAAKAAIPEIERLRVLRPTAVLIGYTQYAEIAGDIAAFSGVIPKQTLSNLSEGDRAGFLRQIISDAIGKALGHDAEADTGHVLVDSLGIRMAQAAFGQEVFYSIANAIAGGWDNKTIRAFTSGHSGAFVLLITGQHGGQEHGVVVKCAKDKRLIDREIAAKDEHLHVLGALGGHLAAIEGQLHTLPGYGCFYYRQSHVLGSSLLDILGSEGWSGRTQGIVNVVVEIECGHYADNQRFGQMSAEEAFPLSKIDVGRARDSLLVLGEVGDVMKDARGWPDGLAEPESMSRVVWNVVEHWQAAMGDQPALFPVSQHGDLNPGNVLIRRQGDVILIDFARLGNWPVGYDLARLAGMLRYRLVDGMGYRDWVVNDLARWVGEGWCQVDAAPNVDGALCPASAFCDAGFGRFVETRGVDEREVLRRGYVLGTLWDSIKVLSYVDMAMFKRIWAMVVCWQLIERLGLSR